MPRPRSPRFSEHSSLAVCQLLAIAVVVPAQGATLSLVAVKVNDVPVTSTSTPTVAPGDQIETDVFVSGWAKDLPDGVWWYSATINVTAGYGSGDWGTISTGVNCDVSCPVMPCTGHLDCWWFSPYPWCESGCCVYVTPPGPRITTSRADYLFHGCPDYRGVGGVCSDLAFVASAGTCPAVLDDGTPRYAGTFNLYVSDDACGAFEFGLVPSRSTLAGGAEPGMEIHPDVEPLTISVASCVPQLLRCNPPNWTIDARIPHDPTDAGVLLSSDSIDMIFNIPVGNLTPKDFDLRMSGCPSPCVPEGVAASGDTLTLTLPDRLPVSYWTDIRYAATRRGCSIGSLPADASGNGTSNESDIDLLVLNLLGDYYLRLLPEECDIDRSAQCTPADLLMAVDLLNGADAFEPWNGRSIDYP